LLEVAPDPGQELAAEGRALPELAGARMIDDVEDVDDLVVAEQGGVGREVEVWRRGPRDEQVQRLALAALREETGHLVRQHRAHPMPEEGEGLRASVRRDGSGDGLRLEGQGMDGPVVLRRDDPD